MARVTCLLSIFLVLHLVLINITVVQPATFKFTNNCADTIWPGLLSGAGTAPLSPTGFPLLPGQSQTITAPSNWSGRMWARTQCTTDPTGKFTCLTGDCGSGAIQCTGGAVPPATLAEFTLSGAGGLDFYDVSLVDGFNLPMLVLPEGGTPGGNCVPTGCAVDLNTACPEELRVAGGGAGEGIACKSACEALGKAEYCCSGEYGTPETCKPSAYSELFKNACPRAYSYAYDDSSSTFTCVAANYVITFCPATTSKKSLGDNPRAAMSLHNNSMVFLGGQPKPYYSTSSPPSKATLSVAIALGLTCHFMFQFQPI